MFAIDRDRHSNGLFDLLQIFVFVTIAERDALAARSGPGRSADSMDVGLCFDRDVEIDDMADVIDIDPTSRNIGCDENSNLSVTERVEDSLASILRSTPMDSFCRNTCSDQ